MNFTHAISRLPNKNFAAGITTSALGAPKYDIMLNQHCAYTQTLRQIGLDVTVLDPLPDFPDAHFVEDVAVITAEVAILTNPGAAARNGEARPMEPILAQHRPIERIHAPGTIDGGDVLQMGKHFFVGISERTDQIGAEEFGAIVSRHGYTWIAVDVAAGLHLKSSINALGDNVLLLTEEFAARPEFAGYQHILIDEDEIYAANTLRINDYLLTPRGFPKTLAKIETLGLNVIEMETSECKKMDGGLTCLSLRF